MVWAGGQIDCRHQAYGFRHGDNVMLNRWFRATALFAISLLGVTLLTACGGGGGGAGSGGFLGESDGPPYRISVAAYDSSGAPATTFSAAEPLTVEVTLTNTSNRAVGDTAVSLSTDVGSIDPANGSSLTNSDGVATFTVAFDGTIGAGLLTATYEATEGTVTATLSVEAIDNAAYLLELNTVDADGNQTRFFSQEQPLIVEVTLFRVAGDQLTPVPDEAVTAAATVGSVSPDTGSTLTDAEGKATFSLAAEADSGAGLLTVSYAYDDLSVERNQTVEIVSGNANFALRIDTRDPGGNSSVTLEKDSPLTVILTLEALTSKVSAANQIVTLDSDIGRVIPESGRLLTDSSGRAEFEVVFDDIIGAGTLIARVDSASEEFFETANIEAVAPELDRDLRITTRNPNNFSSNTFNSDTPLSIEVAITNKAGSVINVDDEIIELTSTVGAVSPSNGNSLTNNGYAQFTLAFDGQVGAGEVTATYSTDAGDVVKTASVEAQATELYSLTMTKTGGDENGDLTSTEDITITIEVRKYSKNGSSSAVPDALVTLTSDVSSVSPENGGKSTDADGFAVFTLTHDGTDGAGEVKASFTSPYGETFTNSLVVESIPVP